MDESILRHLQGARFLHPRPRRSADGDFRVKTAAGEIFHAYRFPHAAVAASVILRDSARDAFLLIERRNDPFRGYLAFPGGFLEAGEESAECAAARELYEETSVKVPSSALHLIDVRSAPERDPRRHVLDIGFYAEMKGVVQASAGDDAVRALWCKGDDISAMRLAFDHLLFWENYLRWAEKL